MVVDKNQMNLNHCQLKLFDEGVVTTPSLWDSEGYIWLYRKSNKPISNFTVQHQPHKKWNTCEAMGVLLRKNCLSDSCFTLFQTAISIP